MLPKPGREAIDRRVDEVPDMSTYVLNKMLREINRDPAVRQRYFDNNELFASSFDLSPEERTAFLAYDIGALYRLGVHGLILRPFTLLKQMPESEYLHSIRE
jgi:hypothetical protein